MRLPDFSEVSIQALDPPFELPEAILAPGQRVLLCAYSLTFTGPTRLTRLTLESPDLGELVVEQIGFGLSLDDREIGVRHLLAECPALMFAKDSNVRLDFYTMMPNQSVGVVVRNDGEREIRIRGEIEGVVWRPGP